PAAPEVHEPVADDPLIASVTQVLDRAAARIDAAAASSTASAKAAAAPASVPKAVVEIDYAHIVVRAVKPAGASAPQPAALASQAPAPQAPLASDSHGGTRTVDGSSLEVAMTRLAIPTTYRLGLAYPSAGEAAVQAEIASAVAELEATKELVNETKAKIDS